MNNATAIARNEIDSKGPPVPEELRHTDISSAFLADLALKHVAELPEPTTNAVADRLRLPRALAEELLHHLFRETLIEVKEQAATGATRYSMLDRGWERVVRARSLCGYSGPAPVSLADYSYLMRLQARPAHSADIDSVRAAMSDLVLPESLLQTVGCVLNSRRSLFLTGPPGTGKTAVSERINGGLPGAIWIPYAIEIDGQIIRIFDSHNHRPVPPALETVQYDRRWIRIERPLVIVGGELTLEHADLSWSDVSRFYEAPFHVKANGGTLVIDDFGRQRVEPHELLNRWILPLERRVDFLTLHNGKKIEVPFEQLVIFSTNLNETDLVDEAFLRRMGYRARLDPPTPDVYIEILKTVVTARELKIEPECFEHILKKYAGENRPMKACEPRDLVDRIIDICLFDGHPLEVTTALIDNAWRNYFGATHSFKTASPQTYPAGVRSLADS